MSFPLATMASCRRSRTPIPSLQLLLLSLFQLACFMISHASPLSFNYSIFDQEATGDLQSYQDVTFVSNAIQLTKNQLDTYLERSMGSVVHNKPLHLWDQASGKLVDFTSNFSFTIDGLNNTRSADGIAFFLSSYPYYNETFNHSWGGALGLFDRNGTKAGRNKIVAVEFDSYINPEYNDSSPNHVGIDICSIVSVAHVDLNTSIRQNIKLFASVSYDASTRKLSVFLSNSSDPRKNWSLSYGVDLREFLTEMVAIGFSASTGDLFELHTIHSWSFSSSDLGLRHKRLKALGFAIAAGVLVGLFWVMFFIRKHMYCKKVSRNMATEEDMAMDVLVSDAIGRASGPRRFPYSVLLSATHNFARERKLGEGGFGEVYMGVLHGSMLEVAIKRISRDSKQGKREYISEITTISQLRHRHLVQLVGYCHERGDLLLVYEYMMNRSLDYHLYRKDKFLTWPVRYKIALGLASALLYLHEEWQQCIIHRDVKPSNVMLDSEFNAKLGDFGLARLMDHDCNPITTVLMGTRGYIAPEYAVTGKPSKESDVYSFGVVILEIACGRKPIEEKEMKGKVNLVQWVWQLYGKRMCLTAADQRLKMEFDEQQMERLMVVGLWCAHPAPDLRPSIRRVIHALNFDVAVPNLPPQMPVPVYCPSSEDLFNFASTSSSRYSASSWSISSPR